jgi:hypothetical protein
MTAEEDDDDDDDEENRKRTTSVCRYSGVLKLRNVIELELSHTPVGDRHSGN